MSKTKNSLMFLIICIAIGIIALMVSEHFYTNWFHHDHGVEVLYYISIVALTGLIAFIAYYQLHILNKTSKDEFLLKIDERYTSAEIVKARTIIQRLYCETKEENQILCNDSHIEKISEKIREIGKCKYIKKHSASKSTNHEECYKDFTILLNFLDFLETVAFFTNKKSLETTDLQELTGESMLYYYKIFKPWIYYRRSKYNNDNYYCEIQKLAKEIEGNLKLKQINTTWPIEKA